MSCRSRCERCSVRTNAICGALPEAAASALNRIAHVRRIPAGQMLHGHQGDPGWFGIIVSGVVKLVKTRSDGRQQIVGLLFPSDFVGRLQDGRSDLAAEATTDLELCCFPRSAFESLMQQHPSLERVLLRRVLDELDTSREWMFLLGRKSAREKVSSLIHFIAERTLRDQDLGASPKRAIEINLPLSRSEMADCLGLTIETVSREVHRLREHGTIETRGRRRVSIPDIEALQRSAEDGSSPSAV